MGIVRDILTYLFTIVYTKFYGDEKVEIEKASTVEFEIMLEGKAYHCLSEETKFAIHFNKWIKTTKYFRLYHVQMVKLETNEKTEGWYPLLCPSFLKDTGYPHHSAIRSHYQLTYKK